MAAQPDDHIGIKKKIAPRDREENGAIFMLRCADLGLSDEALDGMSMGMVYDMLIEQANDHESYPIKGRPGGLKAFFGGS